jgi:hypothetical protein
VKLHLQKQAINEENWMTLCQSLKGHPTMTSLDLRGTNKLGRFQQDWSDEHKSQRTRVLADMLKENTILQTIRLVRHEGDEKIYSELIRPPLERNLYRSRALAIKKADIALRRPLLGRALQAESVRNKSDFLWMFLSGNSDILV